MKNTNYNKIAKEKEQLFHPWRKAHEMGKCLAAVRSRWCGDRESNSRAMSSSITKCLCRCSDRRRS